MESVTFACTHSIVPQSTHDVLLKLVKSDKSQVYFSLVYYILVYYILQKFGFLYHCNANCSL